MKNDRGFVVFELIVALFKLSLFILIVYAAVHFILKFW